MKSSKSTTISKWFEFSLSLFPLFHFLLIILSTISFIMQPSIFMMAQILFFIYLFPVLSWRFTHLFFECPEGVSYIGKKQDRGNVWMAAHFFQYLFLTFSFFEKVLILIPGAFSFWLRLWGSKIGKGIVWTPRVEILDRTHLEIGDYCFIGDHAYLSSHLIQRKDGKLVLLFKKIKIGSKTLVGFSSQLGPGSVIEENTTLPSMSKSLLGRTVRGHDGIRTQEQHPSA